MRKFHRWIGTLVAPLALWIAITGVAVQLIDLGTLASRAPATDPNMMAIRESIDGPPNQEVIRTTDYAANWFPAGYDFGAALQRLTDAAAREAPGEPMRFAELRIGPDGPEGDVQGADRLMRFDAGDESRLVDPAAGPPVHKSSAHDAAKRLHRLFFLGDDMLWINALTGLGLGAMVITGLIVYAKLVATRARTGKRSLVWTAGGYARALHRSIGIVASLFLLVVATSGVLLSFDSLAFGIYRGLYPDRLIGGFAPVGMVGDFSRPLVEAEMPAMLRRTLAAYRAVDTRPVKAIRLRYFAGMPQGIVIAGEIEDARQFLFNAATGEQVGTSGPGYPYTGFPLGWAWHERVKQIHRGNAFGIPGRIMSLLSGIALVFMIASGTWTYVDLLRRRRRAARRGLFWS